MCLRRFWSSCVITSDARTTGRSTKTAMQACAGAKDLKTRGRIGCLRALLRWVASKNGVARPVLMCHHSRFARQDCGVVHGIASDLQRTSLGWCLAVHSNVQHAEAPALILPRPIGGGLRLRPDTNTPPDLLGPVGGGGGIGGARWGGFRVPQHTYLKMTPSSR